jgi:uncharacterized membrane protein
MASINALLMSDMEVLVTLATCAAAGVMLVGLTPDVARAGRTGVKIALGAGLAMAAVAGFAWSSIPAAPHATATVVTLAGG